MKITCDREKLASAFQLAASIAQTRSPKEVLHHVKLDVTSEQSLLMATDMETGIRILVEGIETAAPGKALLNVARVGQILKESGDERLTIESDENRIRIKGEHSEFNLPSANPDEYPTVVGFQEEKYHEIPARLFKEMVRRTVFATDPDSTRFALGGVLLELSGEELIAVGTDGRRLARMIGKGVCVGGHETVGSTTIVPVKSLSLMERSIGDGDDPVHVATRGNDILLRSNRCTLFSRLVEGKYPNWRQVIPSRHESTQITMTSGPFHNVIRQAAIVADQESRGLDFNFGNGILLLSAQTADLGQSKVEMPIGYEGEPIRLKLDFRFLSDFLRVLDLDTQFTMDIVNSTSAVVLTTDDGYAYVVMPMALDK
jgi:DNA polymerase-3 subunit beta